MPEANSEPILSNPLSRYPRIATAPAQKPKLLDRLGEALRSRHYRGLGKGRAGGISPRNLGRSADSDYGKGPQGMFPLWPGENDPARNPVCLSDSHGRQEAPLCWARSMRMDLWVGTDLNWKCNSEGERMSFSRRKEAHLSSALFDPNAFISKAGHIIVARTLFNRQRAIIMEKGKHLVEPSHSIESP
jgi:hypothetical protein